MAFPLLPSFPDRSRLLASQLRAIVQALQGFAVQPADIAWPLLANDNIDMQDMYTIVNMRSLWNIINAAEYGLDTAGLQAAIDAAETAGATCVLIPPDTTISVTGITGPDNANIAVVGCGMSSIISLESSAAGPMFTLNASASVLAGLSFANLQLQGTAGAAGADGILAQGCSNLTLSNVHFVGFPDTALILTNAGTAGVNSCQDVRLSNVTFVGGNIHIKGDDVDGLTMSNVLSTGALVDGMLFEPASAAAIIRDFRFSNVRVESPVGRGISIIGDSATPNILYSRIHLASTSVVSPGGVGITVGSTTAILQDSTISNCEVTTPGSDAFVACIQDGKISDCYGNDATAGDGLDLTTSDNVFVEGCYFQDAFTYGIDASNTTDCFIKNNDVRGSGTGIFKAGATGLLCGHNQGDVGLAIGTSASWSGDASTSATSATQLGPTYTIPANTLSAEGHYIRIRAAGSKVGINGACTFEVRVGGTTFAGHVMAANPDGSVVLDYSLRINSVGVTGASNTSYSLASLDDTDVSVVNGTITNDWATDTTLQFYVTLISGADEAHFEHWNIDMYAAKAIA